MAEENGESSTSREEQEEALVALIEHRTREVQHLHNRIFYYQSQLKEAEQRLNDSQSKLARLRGRSDATSSKSHLDNGTKTVKVEHRSTSPIHKNDGSSRKQSQSKPELLIPAVTPKFPNLQNWQGKFILLYVIHFHVRVLLFVIGKFPFGNKECIGWIHQLMASSVKGSGASLLHSSDCVSPKQRRWPEDITWHPEGNSLFSAYSADGGDSQISILNLNKTQGHARVTFLEDKPHVKGIINSIIFMPWEEANFVTGGSDHAVILWNEKGAGNVWKPKALHRNLHSSAVMGVAGMQQKPIVLSTGADKRIIGFDAHVGRAEFKHQIESKCMRLERQLRLFDIRLRQTEIHAFGWKQESSESQSALINQAWSPDGLYITSGSADPRIHIFDIRYNAQKPSQSIKAHQRRVFKALWLHSIPLLISISSDLNIGLHKTS
ncbi:hypothetical protein FNV43_RR16926 [Rhamnella rubrinervis]|uniref:Uncharacterized protein n=1 Tax=Rhamnella rubrinervis TaxID=2594499 RepID=A0A8K0GZN7_9ROSA|nr:hypothetical protein FNV43_RR16926 [Rhamnella rubrinervis]